MELLLELGSLDLGAPVAPGFGYLSLTMDGAEDAHPQLLEWDGDSLGDIDMVPWRAIGLGAIGRALVAVGETGACLRFADGVRSAEQVPVAGRGPLRGARAIGDEIYAVGMDCQVFRRRADGACQAIDDELRAAPALAGVPGFEAVFGDGARLDGGRVVACGRAGALVLGDGDAWRVVDHAYPEIDFWGVARIDDGRALLSSHRGLFAFDLARGTVEPFAVPLDSALGPAPTHVGRLAAGGGVVWVIGPKAVLELRGDRWRQLLG